MKTGKEIIMNYCKNVQCHDIDHLSNCEDVLIELRKVDKGKEFEYTNVDVCPSSYGLDDFVGTCQLSKENEDTYDCLANTDWDKMCEFCQKCWLQALNLKFENKSDIHIKKPLECIETFTANVKYEGELKLPPIEEDEITQLLKKLYKVAHELDYELCTVLNNYTLKPDYKSIGTYILPERYEGEWMKTMDEVEKYLGIEDE
jgi:hypothetical protein